MFHFHTNPPFLIHTERSRPPTQLTDPWRGGGVFTPRRTQGTLSPRVLQAGVLGSSLNATLTKVSTQAQAPLRGALVSPSVRGGVGPIGSPYNLSRSAPKPGSSNVQAELPK